MFLFLVKRFAALVPTLFGISTLVFFMVQFLPGDPARVMLGERATPEAVKNLREELGLNEHIVFQYFKFVKKTLQGDFGRSFKSRELVSTEIKNHFPATIELAFFSLLLASFFGILVGIVSAVKRKTFFDYFGMVFALVGISMPVFWLGLVLIMVFAVNFNFLPVSDRISPEFIFEPITNFYLLDALILKDLNIFTNVLQHLVLPAVTLATIPLAIIARLTRSSMLEVLNKDFVRTAHAKGLSKKVVIFKHVLKNALIPIVTVIGLQFGLLLGGAILTETVFAWPGVGRWVLNSVLARDFTSVQGGAITIATAFVLINLLVDVLYFYLNPKLRSEFLR
ncbi:ABC transporter permease [bacterium]|nr:ABC transporter permease [bacterium]